MKKFAVVENEPQNLESADMYMKLKEKYYKDLENMHEKYDVFLHDIRHMLRTIAALSEEGNCEEIGNIVGKMRTTLSSIDEQLVCGHKILNALFTERRAYAKDRGVKLELKISEPLYFNAIDDLDLIALMGNLLDNAIEAETLSTSKEGISCNIHMVSSGRHMVIQVENSCEEKKNGKIKLMKQQERIGDKHGIGLASVQEIVRKYGGIYEGGQTAGRYSVKIILPAQSSWEEEASYMSQQSTYMQPVFK